MDPAAAEAHLHDTHGETLAAVADCLAAAAEGLPRPAGRATVVARQEAALGRAGLLEPLVDLLEAAVSGAGADLAARPVAAPPYVVLTGRGPMLRGSAGDRRLVVLLQGFELSAAGDGYVPTEFALRVAVRE